MNIQDLYQEIIIDHGTHPRNCCALEKASCTAEGFNPLCGDKVHLYLKIENEEIKQASFTGSGCAISIACASLMTEILPGKKTTDAKMLSETFKTALKSESSDTKILGKLSALLGVREFPTRIKCATLPWHTLEAAMKQESTQNTITVTTESIDE